MSNQEETVEPHEKKVFKCLQTKTTCFLLQCIKDIIDILRTSNSVFSWIHFSFQVETLSGCNEFMDMTLRQNERTALNKLNKDKNRTTIR